MFEASEVKRLIEQGLPCELVVIEGEDGVHFRGIVVSAAFDQQLVHARLTSRARRDLLPTARA